MRFHVLACDYDRTLATDGRVAPDTLAALDRVRGTGRRLVLVTGRRIDDLASVCPALDTFDLVVGENGAVLFDPAHERVETLASAPPRALLDALIGAGVPYVAGRVVVATWVPHDTAARRVLAALGLAHALVFNRDEVMVLPPGVSKASGLRAALARLGCSRHNTVAVGDAENDEDLLASVGCGVAVANAVPAVARAADLVTAAPNGAGVRELVDALVRDDLAPLPEAVRRRGVVLGTMEDGTVVAQPGFGPSLVVTGDRAPALAALLVERLMAAEWIVWWIDPDGMQEVSRPGMDMARVSAATIDGLAGHAGRSLAVELSALPPAGRDRAVARLLEEGRRLRTERGAPHWVVVGTTDAVPAPAVDGVCLVVPEVRALDPAALGRVGRVLATSTTAVTDAWPEMATMTSARMPLAHDEALDVRVDGGRPTVVRRFRVTRAGMVA